jgi:hypothetical protein
MTTKIVTDTLRSLKASTFIDEVDGTPHFLVTAKHISYSPDDSSVPDVESTAETEISLYNDMLFGKRITSDDVAVVIPRYDWESGTVYTQYETADPELMTKNFYVSTPDGGNYNVYKCLFNNSSANSTVQPSGQDLEPFVTPGDGYVWKYMYTYTTAQRTKFATADFIPVFANTAVEDAATPGTIEVIEIDDAGAGYDNFYEAEFRSQDVQIGGDTVIYGLSEDASALNGFYENCIIKVTDGAATGQYRLIVDYTISGGQKKITIDRAFTDTPAPTDTYEIYPAVFVTGDGSETADCIARAVINPDAANSVGSVEVLDSGAGFRVATAEIRPDNTVGVDSEAQFHVMVSPPAGHGFDAERELGGKYACLSVKLTGTESNNIPTENDYRQVGVLKDPLFSNVVVKIAGSGLVGNFADGEEVLNYRGVRLPGTVTTVASNTHITGLGTYFFSSITEGDLVLLSDGTNQHVSEVVSVSNNSSAVLSTTVPYANTTSTISIVDTIATATLRSSNSTALVLDNCSASLQTTWPYMLGMTSAATVDINVGSDDITINGSDMGTFSYFIQMNKILGTLSSGSFVDDEEITQTDFSARLYSYASGSPDIIYATNVSGDFEDGASIIGTSSGAVFTPTNKYPGALEVDSGQILYIENLAPITRATNKSETIKIILEF